jgi:acyl carrier protein
MALAVKKIKDRILDSIKHAEIMSSLEKSAHVSNELKESHTLWKRRLLGTQQS